MAKRNDKRWKIVPPGTFAGRKITFASTDEVEASADVASEFMSSYLNSIRAITLCPTSRTFLISCHLTSGARMTFGPASRRDMVWP